MHPKVSDYITKKPGQRGWKTQARKLCKAILNNSNLEDTSNLGIIHDEEIIDFLMSIAKLRTDDRFMNIEDIRLFSVERVREAGSKPHNTFVVHRFDGSSNRLGYVQCLQPQTSKGKFIIACRTAVSDFCLEYGSSKDKCERCGKKTKLVVHHRIDMPFGKIVRRFMDIYNFRSFGAVVDKKTGRFKGDFGKLFEDFHKKHAILNAVCIPCHKEIHEKKI